MSIISYLYTVYNNTSEIVTILDANGTSKTLPPYTSNSLLLDGAGYTTCVNTFGAANVVLVSGQTNILSVQDTQSLGAQGAVAMSVGTTYAAQRNVGVVCTTAGNVVFMFPDGSTITVPVAVGWQIFHFSVTQIVSAGTTAVATYYNLK